MQLPFFLGKSHQVPVLGSQIVVSYTIKQAMGAEFWNTLKFYPYLINFRSKVCVNLIQQTKQIFILSYIIFKVKSKTLA